MHFLNPPRSADSKSPIVIFYRVLGPGHLRGPRVSLGRILGVPSIEPLLGGGGVKPGGSVDPPPQLKALPSHLPTPSSTTTATSAYHIPGPSSAVDWHVESGALAMACQSVKLSQMAHCPGTDEKRWGLGYPSTPGIEGMHSARRGGGWG